VHFTSGEAGCAVRRIGPLSEGQVWGCPSGALSRWERKVKLAQSVLKRWAVKLKWIEKRGKA